MYADGIYVYFIAFYDVNGIVLSHQAEIVFLTTEEEVPENPIDINLPWDSWVRANKGKLPYPVGK